MLDTQELAPVAIALLLSVIGGIGTFLMDVRDGRQSGNLLGLVTEIYVAVTASRAPSESRRSGPVGAAR